MTPYNIAISHKQTPKIGTLLKFIVNFVMLTGFRANTYFMTLQGYKSIAYYGYYYKGCEDNA